MESIEISYGYCHCGCGGKTNIATQTRTELGWVEGEPFKFKRGHATKGTTGKNCKSVIVTPHGYERTLDPTHSRAHRGYVYTHILIAESLLGKPLPPNAVVHHIDGDKIEYQNNLVLCENESYHQLLHQREIALRACGHATWRKCPFCKQYDDLKNMHPNGRSYHHRTCANEYARERRLQK